MANTEHSIEMDGFRFNLNPLGDGVNGQSYAQLAFYAHCAKAFEDADREWREKVAGDPALKYGDMWYPYSMVLAVEGMADALVMNVDDIVQVFPIPMGERVEEAPK